MPELINISKDLKSFLFIILVLSACKSVNAGVNNFTELIYLDEWLIERKVDIQNNQIKCRASVPANATWFGARLRLGSNDELIKPVWISINEKALMNAKLTKVRKILEGCRSGFVFLPDV